MKLPISDLMDTCHADSIEIHTETNTEAIKANVLHRIHAERKPKKLFRPSVLLVAAAIMTLLVGTAVASTTAMSSRKVEDSAETVWFSYVSETDDYQRIHWPDASYAVEFDVNEHTKSQENIVYFRLGWLPTEFNGEEIAPVVPPDEWLRQDHYLILDNHPSTNIIPYRIDMHTFQTHEFGQVYYLNGETTLVKKDNWNGWNRMELTVDYTNSKYVRWPQPVNYLLLYDPEESILINIHGMMDFKTYETIAEHLEVNISDEPLNYTPPEKHEQIGSPAGILDLGRG